MQTPTIPPLFQPLGDCAVRVEFGREINPATARRLHRLGAALDADPIEGVIEWVCGYAVLSVYYRPWVIDYQTLCAMLKRRLKHRTEPGAAPADRVIEIPVCYGGDFGPDLPEIAAQHGLTTTQVIRAHSRPRYLVCFLGFLPGFAYLSGLPKRLETPRRATPRLRVPAGAVGIAGAQTGVYPSETPGGWQILGQTPLRLYDPGREPLALLAAGDRVRFVPITPEQFHALEKREKRSSAAN